MINTCGPASTVVTYQPFDLDQVISYAPGSNLKGTLDVSWINSKVECALETYAFEESSS